MKLKHLFILIAILGILGSCKDDDDIVELLPQEEQNILDDQAIVKYLKEHYFNDRGKAEKLESDSTNTHTSLYSLAKQVDGGYWYVENPKIIGENRAVKDNTKDSILLQYEMKVFRATKHNDSINYAGMATYSSTINTSGYPIWDPTFYYAKPSEGVNLDYYVIEGFVDGIKHFKSTGRNPEQTPAVNFQGLIIIPSRLAYNRSPNALKLDYDKSVIINFELYNVLDRKLDLNK